MQVYIILHLVAPKPRLPFPSEKTYLTTKPDGTVSAPRPLPCWYDRWRAEGRLNQEYPTIPAGFPVTDQATIEPAEVEVSVVVPAYNEEARICAALDEMVEYLDQQFGRPNGQTLQPEQLQEKPALKRGRKDKRPTTPHRLVFKPDSTSPPPSSATGPTASMDATPSGYEILIIDDGSRDRTVEVVLDFSRRRGLHDIIRVVKLEKNRGKGGAVTHGLRHVRGKYAVFADADGASRFSDLGRLIEGCEDVVDGSNRGVAIGSRAHLVGSEAVVKVQYIPPLFILPPLLTKQPILKHISARRNPQLPHAFLPLRAHDPHPAGHLAHPRHPVWLQALLARRVAAHRALHAHRGLDLRH
jgi:dolichyl-phosphate beta-glucosyltransferase